VPVKANPTLRTNAIGGYPAIRFSGAADYCNLGNYGAGIQRDRRSQRWFTEG
jgi:hypothetical protein